MSSLDISRAVWRKSTRSGVNGACVEVALSGAVWRKSTRSGLNGNCVEVALSGAVWRKSTRSGLNGDCVEVTAVEDVVAVRDSKHQSGPVLAVPRRGWAAFVGGVRGGAFGVPPA